MNQLSHSTVMGRMIHADRIRPLNGRPARGQARYVLYWMQASQRAAFNPALEYAIERANALGLPTQVVFALTRYPEANARHYAFMLQGLADVAARLTARGVGFCIRYGNAKDVVAALAKDAALVICDRGYLRPQRRWREALAGRLDVELVQVEGDVVVPADVASDKREYAARTLRPKLHRLIDAYVDDLEDREVEHSAARLDIAGDVRPDDHETVFEKLALDRSVPPVWRFLGGETRARERLEAFVDDGLSRYADQRQKPEAQAVSHLSPYLHFGQISPVEIALTVRQTKAGDDRAKFLEELIVRRELAINYVLHTPRYDTYDALPDWSKAALQRAHKDRRPHLYAPSTLEAAQTHDPYWNAAMTEMKATGYMHNSLRMYWGKKVLEWSREPSHAFATLLRLNNRYFLDGRDANSFTNVGWIFGLHDRPWGRQPVFGTVRSMGPNTFKKFDADAYVEEVERLCAAEAG